MADQVVNVSGYDTSYGIDAYLVHSTATTSDYRQIVAIGGDSSGAGSTVNVNDGHLVTSSTISESTTLAVSGGLTLATLFIDEDASGDNPQTNTTIKAAPGSGTRIVLYGYSLSVAGSASNSYGEFAFTDGAIGSPSTGSTNLKIVGRMQGTNHVHMSNDFPHGVPLTANTALQLTTAEGSGQMYIYGVIYYTTESV
tara:strand:- start:3061 stop:3651 length:591 start_codon:yes stop_codon:yes gene_type:complete